MFAYKLVNDPKVKYAFKNAKIILSSAVLLAERTELQHSFDGPGFDSRQIYGNRTRTHLTSAEAQFSQPGGQSCNIEYIACI